jgi:hypothetical protein
MTSQHPITPPAELVQEWIDTPIGLGLGCHPAITLPIETLAARLTEATQWGYQQAIEELETFLKTTG